MTDLQFTALITYIDAAIELAVARAVFRAGGDDYLLEGCQLREREAELRASLVTDPSSSP